MMNIESFQYSRDFMTWREGRWAPLLAEFKGRSDLRLLEIGTYEGRTLIWLLQEIMNQPTCTADAIDCFWDGTELALRHNLKVAGVQDRVTIHPGRSEKILPTLSKSYDIVFIDGCHCARHVLSDAVMSWERLKVGGMMIFDDYEFDQTDYFKADPHSIARKSPRIAVDAFMECYHTELELIHRGYEVLVKKIRDVHR